MPSLPTFLTRTEKLEFQVLVIRWLACSCIEKLISVETAGELTFLNSELTICTNVA